MAVVDAGDSGDDGWMRGSGGGGGVVVWWRRGSGGSYMWSS